MSKEPYHYLDNEDEYEDEDDYWTGDGSDDGYDAIKDANAEMGLGPRNSAGFGVAKRRGWLRKKRR